MPVVCAIRIQRNVKNLSRNLGRSSLAYSDNQRSDYFVQYYNSSEIFSAAVLRHASILSP